MKRNFKNNCTAARNAQISIDGSMDAHNPQIEIKCHSVSFKHVLNTTLDSEENTSHLWYKFVENFNKNENPFTEDESDSLYDFILNSIHTYSGK